MNKSILWIPTIILILAVLPLPYAYYLVLRLIIPVFAILTAFSIYSKKSDDIFIYVFGFLAILYNPLIPIHLTKDIWMVLNVLSAFAFIFQIFKKTEGD